MSQLMSNPPCRMLRGFYPSSSSQGYVHTAVHVRKGPSEGIAVLPVGTTSAPSIMEDMGFSSAFNVQLHVPALKEGDVRTVLTALNAFSAADVSPLLPHAACLVQTASAFAHVAFVL